MKCPFCESEELKVIDSRDATEQNAIRRRRECQSCGKRFTTFEMMELSVQVHKKDGRYEDFQRQKLVCGIEGACRHTKISRDQVYTIADSIMGEMMQRQQKQVSTKEIGEMVMEHLLTLDAIAYIRFACVYRRFKEINELTEAIASIQTEDETRSLKKEKITEEQEVCGGTNQRTD